jgi:hypothetical protein
MSVPKLYDQYFIQKGDERRHLFQILSSNYELRTGIYPGSFVHITPAFYIPEMMFIDSDKRINRFFSDANTLQYIDENKQYSSEPKVNWLQQDFTQDNPIQENYYDIMFSFYAGFISQHCKENIKSGGILVANNSHGDATLAIADPEYICIGVIQRNDQKFRLQTNDLEAYLTKKNGAELDIEKVKAKMIGEKFRQSAFAYVFQKT